MREAAVVSTARTPIDKAYRGAFEGCLRRYRVAEPGRIRARAGDRAGRRRRPAASTTRLCTARDGGAVSIGHLCGMTGSRCVGHALLEGKRRSSGHVVITMCISSGVGSGDMSGGDGGDMSGGDGGDMSSGDMGDMSGAGLFEVA